MPPLTPTIVFDLDGTLVDTVPDIAAALDAALARFGSSPTSPDEAAAMMGDGLNAFFWRAIVAKRLDLSAEDAAAAQRRFIAGYRQSPARLSRLYPGIRDLLVDIRSHGVRTAVCTNKHEPIAVDILERLDIRHFFDSVVGYRDDRPKKPDPKPLLQAIASAGGHHDRTLMIGDSGADSSAASAARTEVILVSYGYSSVPVRTLPADDYADDVDELHKKVMHFITAESNVVYRAPFDF